MTSGQRIPEDLAQRAPGPELAAALAGIELPRLTGFDAVEVLRAEYRQLAHAQARVLAVLAEVGCCEDADSLVRVEPGQFAAEEARAALVWTRRRADEEFWFARDLLSRLPAAHAAMLAGDCDRPRARILAEWTKDLSPEQARAVVDRLLPRIAAAELTTGQLIEQLKKLAIAIDPQWARRRYEAALADRKVVGTRNPDGTANLAGYNLPLERVAAAAEHIDHLAKAAKRAGSGRRLDHLRAELFLGMTDGAYTGLDDAAIVMLLLATTDSDDEHTDLVEPTDRPEADTGESAAPAADDTADNDTASPTSSAGSARGGIELRARLSTLLGHDRYPGEITGWGPIHAELARDLADTLIRGQWRWVVTNETGLLLDAGTTRARPTGARRRGPRTRDVVELQIPETLLTDPGECGRWAAVISDITRQHADQHDPHHRFAGDAHRRHPGAAQRRWLQMRDRYCLRPGCRVPAGDAQQDHTLNHCLGGPTLEWNLGGLCGHDHQVKTDGGWQLTRDEHGHFQWTSRLGRTYDVPPRPIIEPLPDPLPRDTDPHPHWLPPNGDWEHDTILDDPPLPEPEPPPRPATDPDEPPPF